MQRISADTFLEQYRLDELSNKPLLAVVEERNRGNHEEREWAQQLREEVKEKLIASSVPIYPSVERAARAANKLVDYYQHLASR
jgi:hypothetical protein